MNDNYIERSAKRDALAEIMPALDELFEGRIQFPAGSLDEMKGQGFELTGAARYGRLRVALSGKHNLMLLNHGRNLHCLAYRTRLGKGCSAKNAAEEKKSSVARKPRSAKWVEVKLLGNTNDWKIDRKSS